MRHRDRFDFRSIDVAALLAELDMPAKRRGDIWTACCPSHAEKTASWSIIDTPGSGGHGLHYCFGCKYNGTATDLVMHVLKLDLGDAREWIREHAMGEPEVPVSVEVEIGAPARRAFVLPREVILDPFEKWVALPKRYVLKRGFDGWQVTRWGIGYAVSGKLAGRIVFPAYDGRGQLLTYSARTFVRDRKKYLAPLESDGADIGGIFGERYWPATESRDSVVVVEGAINALACERAYGGAVAAMHGSEILPAHLLKLATFKRVVVLTDPDLAGETAADKLADSLSRHVDVVRVSLPEGTDAADTPTEVLARLLKDAVAVVPGVAAAREA